MDLGAIIAVTASMKLNGCKKLCLLVALMVMMALLILSIFVVVKS